jgi:glycosyltransferase involved in cell wall biosynthesis
MLETKAADAVAGQIRAVPRAAPAGIHRRFRVLMVAPTSFFADYGCHVRILEEARALGALGHAITIVTYQNGRDVEGIDIRRTPPIPWRRGYEVGSSRHKIGFDALLFMRALPLAFRNTPDIVHGHLHEGALIGGAIARALKRPLVFDFQGSLSAEMVDHGFIRPGGMRHAAVLRAERGINRLADAIITSSRGAVDLLAQEFAVPAHRITALPDCVDTERFRPGTLDPSGRLRLAESLGIPPDRDIVVYLGLLAPYQGTDLLLEAAARVVAKRPATHFLVMGFPGTETYAVKAATLGLGDHVTFTGRVLYDSAPHFLSLGTVAVAPKLSRTEGSGKVLTYMAMGLPVVAFDTPVSRDYLGPDGRYAAPGDAGALAARILELIADRAAAAALGARLRQRARVEYGWTNAARTIEDVYGRVARVAAPERA